MCGNVWLGMDSGAWYDNRETSRMLCVVYLISMHLPYIGIVHYTLMQPTATDSFMYVSTVHLSITVSTIS